MAGMLFYSKPYFRTKDYKCPDLGIFPDLGMLACMTNKRKSHLEENQNMRQISALNDAYISTNSITWRSCLH